METYRIAMGDGAVQSFEVVMYPHYQERSCRYGVFQEGKSVASLSQTGAAFYITVKIPA